MMWGRSNTQRGSHPVHVPQQANKSRHGPRDLSFQKLHCNFFFFLFLLITRRWSLPPSDMPSCISNVSLMSAHDLKPRSNFAIELYCPAVAGQSIISMSGRLSNMLYFCIDAQSSTSKLRCILPRTFRPSPVGWALCFSPTSFVWPKK